MTGRATAPGRLGSSLHLEHAEQMKAIAKISQALKQGGLFLFTAGDRDGSIEGTPMNGVPFRYWSFRCLELYSCFPVTKISSPGYFDPNGVRSKSA
jgi:hypothetical protein